MGKRWIPVAFCLCITLLLVATGTIWYFVLSDPNGSPEEEPYFERNGVRIYAEEEALNFLRSREQDNITEIRLVLNSSLDQIIAEDIAGRYLEEPVMKGDPIPGDYWFEGRNETGTLRIKDRFNVFMDIRRSTGLSTKKLPESSLVNTSEELIIQYRGHMDDLELIDIACATCGQVNSDTGEEVFLGYDSYSLYYQQSVSGLNVSGEYGKLIITIDPWGNPLNYRDRTVEIDIIEELGFEIITPDEAILEFARTREEGNEYVLWDMDLVFQVNHYSGTVYLQYELKVLPRNGFCELDTIYIDV